MDQRLIFDSNIINYEQIRPLYPQMMFDDIFSYLNSDKKLNVLEIGIGTGQATKPFLEKNYNVTAVELGENFTSYVKNKFSIFENFNVICDDFMDVSLPNNHFDLVYSATAFHWLPFEKYDKVESFLKSGGVLALFWNRPFVRNEQDITNRVNTEIYNKYFGVQTVPKKFESSDLNKMIDELNVAGYKNVSTKLYERTRTLSTKEYISLLNTYSDHCSLPADTKFNFEQDMIKALNKVGGKINIYDTIDLYLAKK